MRQENSNNLKIRHLHGLINRSDVNWSVTACANPRFRYHKEETKFRSTTSFHDKSPLLIEFNIEFNIDIVSLIKESTPFSAMIASYSEAMDF